MTGEGQLSRYLLQRSLPGEWRNGWMSLSGAWGPCERAGKEEEGSIPGAGIPESPGPENEGELFLSVLCPKVGWGGIIQREYNISRQTDYNKSATHGITWSKGVMSFLNVMRKLKSHQVTCQTPPWAAKYHREDFHSNLCILLRATQRTPRLQELCPAPHHLSGHSEH